MGRRVKRNENGLTEEEQQCYDFIWSAGGLKCFLEKKDPVKAREELALIGPQLPCVPDNPWSAEGLDYFMWKASRAA